MTVNCWRKELEEEDGAWSALLPWSRMYDDMLMLLLTFCLNYKSVISTLYKSCKNKGKEDKKEVTKICQNALKLPL